jgi:DNA-directed RNA polymerase subunit RPC12/RpoP
MTLKEASEELLKIADDIEKEANEVTEFVCVGCNHTASLAKINGKRVELAKEAGENVTVSPITVNDKVACPACGGTMAYKATEAAEKYYFDPEKAAAEKSAVEEKEPVEEEKKPEEEKKAAEPVDYDKL